MDQASDEIDLAFGSIYEPFWDPDGKYFPECLYPVFWSELDMEQSEALLLDILGRIDEQQDLLFPAIVAGLILIAIYGARRDYFALYATIRLLDAIIEDTAVNAAFLDLGITNLEKLVGTATLMVYSAKYENENGF